MTKAKQKFKQWLFFYPPDTSDAFKWMDLRQTNYICAFSMSDRQIYGTLREVDVNSAYLICFIYILNIFNHLSYHIRSRLYMASPWQYIHLSRKLLDESRELT